jgi:hypothetical protein
MSQPATDSKNRRHSIRRRPRGATRVACFKGSMGLGTNLALELLDVSETGVRLRVREPLDLKQELQVELTGLVHRRPVKLAAAVIWCVPAADGSYCVGARFSKYLRYADLQQLL